MWPRAGFILAVFGLVSAGVFSEDPSPSEPDVNNHEASFSSNFDRRENSNLFTNSEWSNEAPNSASLNELDGQYADSLLPGTEANLAISDDWAYQLEADMPTSGCNVPARSRTRLKRFDAQCPAGNPEDKRICETALFPILLCCLGPSFAQYVVVNRCTPYDTFVFYCGYPKYVYCCRELDGNIGVVCLKPFPGSDEDEDQIPFPPSLNRPYPGEIPPPGAPLFPNPSDFPPGFPGFR